MKTKLIKKVLKGVGRGQVVRWLSGVWACKGCPKNNQHKKENYLQYYQELQKLHGAGRMANGEKPNGEMKVQQENITGIK